MSEPNRRERAIVEMLGDAVPVEQVLAGYREELLKPFDELRRDFEALGDDRVARYLDALIRTARGEP